jgi:hypothetical protein
MQATDYKHKLGIELAVAGPWETEWDIPHEEFIKALTEKLSRLLDSTPLELRTELLFGEITPVEQ